MFSFLSRLRQTIEHWLRFPGRVADIVGKLEYLEKHLFELKKQSLERGESQVASTEHVAASLDGYMQKSFSHMENQATTVDLHMKKVYDRLETHAGRMEALEVLMQKVATDAKLTRANSDFLRRVLNDDDRLRLQVEHAYDVHPEWMANPLAAYKHDYSVGNPDASPRNDTIIFLHVRKCGGSTLSHIIQRNVRSIAFRKDFLSQPNLDPRTVLEAFRQLPKELQQKERAKWRQYDVFADHGIFGLHELLDRPYKYMTMLRHPIDRVLSLYRYSQSLPDVSWKGVETIGPRARSKTFEEFLSDEDFLKDIEQNSYKTVFSGASTGTVHQAAENLASFDTVLLLEKFDDSIALLEEKYGWKDELFVRGAIVPREGRVVGDVTESHRDQLTEKEVKMASDVLKDDLTLYEKAVEIFESQRVSLAA